MPKLRDLPTNVTITEGFPGEYIWPGGTSYYLDGNRNSGQIHFSLEGGNDDELINFHISRSIHGLNVGIWYKPGGVYSNTNVKNLPTAEKAEFESWWNDNEDNCHAAAKDFWDQLTK